MTAAAQAAASVRQASVADAKAMALLHARCFPRAWKADAIGTFVADPACVALVVAAPQAEGELRGFLLARAAADEAELLTLAVDPAYRRRGLAHSLLTRAMAMLRLGRVERLYLEVEAGNEPALRLYQRLGARKIGNRPGYYEHGADAAVFSLTL